ncbi:MAG: terpene cyclase/mutase family protein [Planctomycetes bacterium]|nr:terpene cyclase/mutase family protein [Planctomycetota bacterium]
MYPTEAVREISKSFICIRVDHDQSPDLVKRFGVGPLSDVRLLDPEGQELKKLVGFTSASRLVSECRAVLDRSQGKGGTREVGNHHAASSVDKPVSEAAINKAVEKGVSYLRAEWKKGFGPSAPGLGPEPLVLFAWQCAGVSDQDPDVKSLREKVRVSALTGTYQVALEALVLSGWAAKRDRERLQACARFLIESQLENGQWTYAPAIGASSPALGDNSNTAYAVLGIAACHRVGIDVPESVVKKAEKWWRSSQNQDGGWGYRTDRETESYASMTESGISSLILCRRLLPEQFAADTALERANTWLAAHFSVQENRNSAYQQGRLLYHLFALERVGSLCGEKSLVGHSWFEEGASYLVSTQNDDGSWDDGADTPIPNTSLALLFLTRATHMLH